MVQPKISLDLLLEISERTRKTYIVEPRNVGLMPEEAVFCHFYPVGQVWHIARLWKQPTLQNQLPTCVDVRSLLRATASFKIT